MTKPVICPRPQAVHLARYEAASLRARAESSQRCKGPWSRAAAAAEKVAADLAAQRNQPALERALIVGPLWKKAAECEGFAVAQHYPALGAVREGEFDIEAAFTAQAERIETIRKTQEEGLRWRKIATYATIAGALFAMVRLTDIYFAVKARRRV